MTGMCMCGVCVYVFLLYARCTRIHAQVHTHTHTHTHTYRKMKTSRDVLIMDTSHWDLIDNDITSFVCLGLSPVIAAMEELRCVQTDTCINGIPHRNLCTHTHTHTHTHNRQNPLTENLRIIWVASFPMPPQHDGTFRSVPTAAAADIFLAPHWARLGVEVCVCECVCVCVICKYPLILHVSFPRFYLVLFFAHSEYIHTHIHTHIHTQVLEVLPLLRPRVAEVADYHHWTSEYSREGDFKGEVGAEIARMLTGTLCAL